MPTTPEATSHQSSRKFSILLPLRAIQNHSFQYETPCYNSKSQYYLLRSTRRTLIPIGKCTKKLWVNFLHMSFGLNSLPGSYVVSHYDSFLMNHFMLLLLLQLYVINVKEPSFYFAQVLGRFFFYCLLQLCRTKFAFGNKVLLLVKYVLLLLVEQVAQCWFF